MIATPNKFLASAIYKKGKQVPKGKFMEINKILKYLIPVIIFALIFSFALACGGSPSSKIIEELRSIEDYEVFKEQVRILIEKELKGELTKLEYDESNNTLYLEYNTRWRSDGRIKREIFFDITSVFALNNYDVNLDVKATKIKGFQLTTISPIYHAYTKTDILAKIKNDEISYDEWLKEAF